MSAVPMLDAAAITPEMARAAGLNPHRLQQQLGDASTVPITQADRDELGRIRNEKLQFMKKLAIIMFFTSLVSIIVGIVAIGTASEFPYAMGGGVLAGFAGIIGCIMTTCMLKEGNKTPTGSETTTCLVGLTRCYLILGMFLTQMIAIAFGMGGVWGTVECLKRKPSDDWDEWSFNSCHPDTPKLLTISILTLVLAVVIFILFIMSCWSFCCNIRAFGVKSGYERILDLQMARTLEMQRLQQQQANIYGPQVGMQYPQGQAVPNQYTPMIQGPYTQPMPQGYYNQSPAQGQQGQYMPQGIHGHHVPQGHHDQNMPREGYPYPSAPPKNDNFSDDPPSYRDVMEK